MSKKISDLTAASTPLAGTELVEIVQGGTSKKVEASYLGGAAAVRERLSSARTYYVRSDGSDSNNGLANTSGGAFLTIQKAVDVISGNLDIASGVVVEVQLGDGTYTGSVSLKHFVGAGSVVIQGNSGTPANVLISTTSASAIVNSSKSNWSIKDLKIQTTTSGYCLAAQNGGSISFSNIVFGAAAFGHLYADTGGVIFISGNYSVVGSAPFHIQMLTNSVLSCFSRTVTLTGSPAFGTAFASVSGGASAYYASNTYSGSATGKRYDATLNGVINTGAGTLPGDVAGTTATGGQYA